MCQKLLAQIVGHGAVKVVHRTITGCGIDAAAVLTLWLMTSNCDVTFIHRSHQPIKSMHVFVETSAMCLVCWWWWVTVAAVELVNDVISCLLLTHTRWAWWRQNGGRRWFDRLLYKMIFFLKISSIFERNASYDFVSHSEKLCLVFKVWGRIKKKNAIWDS